MAWPRRRLNRFHARVLVVAPGPSLRVDVFPGTDTMRNEIRRSQWLSKWAG